MINIYQFSRENFSRLITHHNNISEYIYNYLESICAKVIIEEENYIDKDYLEDYAQFYAACFKKYQKLTKRLHFFSDDKINDEYIKELIAQVETIEDKTKALNRAYLGFVVIKPLPQTIVGRTCLKTFESGKERFYSCVNKYYASLFGIELEINSLPFQEQDKVVAACATSALWSCFHGMRNLTGHSVPSPSTITRMATEHLTSYVEAVNIDARSISNKGLHVSQMLHAMKKITIEPIALQANNTEVLLSIAYPYLKASIPIVFICDILDREDKLLGRHAVLLNGYYIGNGLDKEYEHQRIDKLYAHDDQVGPFARMEIVDGDNKYLTTSWGNTGNKASPIAVLIPLYKKIRITIEHIEGISKELILLFDMVYELLIKTDSKRRIDLYLTSVNNYKKQILTNQRYKEIAESMLHCNFPRFIWKLDIHGETELLFEAAFDATGIEQDDILLHCNFMNIDVASLFKKNKDRVEFKPMSNIIEKCVIF